MVVGGTISLIGSDPRPTVTNTKVGPIFSIDIGADVGFENLEITGARVDPASQGTYSGAGISCPVSPAGARSVRVVQSALTHNEGVGLRAQACTVTLIDILATANGIGCSVTDSIVTIDRTTFTGNTGTPALGLDGGVFHVTNSFVVRNGGGVAIYTQQPGNFDFNTVVDNTITGVEQGLGCNAQGTTFSTADNIVARNGRNGVGCTSPGSIVQAEVTDLHFKSPDVAPYDYHLTAGSKAIDMATVSTLDHDFDGDARPKGAGRDIGADEAQ